jgi:hypothetical protein
VRARRELGDDAAVALVDLVLRGDDVGEYARTVGDQRGRRLVARALESEDDESGRAQIRSSRVLPPKGSLWSPGPRFVAARVMLGP